MEEEIVGNADIVGSIESDVLVNTVRSLSFFGSVNFSVSNTLDTKLFEKIYLGAMGFEPMRISASGLEADVFTTQPNPYMNQFTVMTQDHLVAAGIEPATNASHAYLEQYKSDFLPTEICDHASIPGQLLQRGRALNGV